MTDPRTRAAFLKAAIALAKPSEPSIAQYQAVADTLGALFTETSGMTASCIISVSDDGNKANTIMREAIRKARVGS